MGENELVTSNKFMLSQYEQNQPLSKEVYQFDKKEH
jgi:hypothetical protein